MSTLQDLLQRADSNIAMAKVTKQLFTECNIYVIELAKKSDHN